MIAKRYLLLSVVVTALVCGAAFAARSALTKQFGIPVGAGSTRAGKIKVPGWQLRADGPFMLPDGVTRGARAGIIKAVQQGDRTVTVRGYADIADRRPADLRWVWLLRAYQDKTKLAWEHHYMPLVIDEGQTAATPQFIDNIDLKPGNYRLELTIYGVLRGFDFSTLKFGQDIRRVAYSRVSMAQKLQVQ